MRLLYFGSIQSPEDCTLNPSCSETMNVTQITLLEKLRGCGMQTIDVISVVTTPAWERPRWRCGQVIDLSPGIRLIEVPFFSFGPFQPLTQALFCSWELIRHLIAARPDGIIVNAHLARYGIPVLFAHWLLQIAVVAVLPDVPPFRGRDRLRPRRGLEWIVVRFMPGAVVFSNHVEREFRGGRPTIRMVRPPGEDLLDLPPTPPDPARCNVYFAGTLAEVSGTDLLLKAIEHIEQPGYQFWFSGRGPLDEMIREAARRDSRITHWGFVSREKYCELLQRATVLINPRPSRLPENRYNFPSKLMEYMAAGRPIISTATSDVAEHYRDAIVLLDEETPQRLAELIQHVCELPVEEQSALGQRARQHVQHETWEAQAQSILDFLASLKKR
jgi:glycosyltransferase involved in cell wall biosynthesis